MERLKDLKEHPFPNGSLLSIGNFDGVHRGHQAILSTLVKHAANQNVPAVAMTFEPHPASLIAPERVPPRLTSPDKKAELIASLGVDYLIEYPTDWALLGMTPREFFDEIVLSQLNARGMVEGPNFFFGKDRAGDVETLRQFCREESITFEAISAREIDGQIISSSVIRKLLTTGDVKRAATLLGRNYTIEGTVVTGAGRGRSLDFPTANIAETSTMLPGHGVYAAWCETPQGQYKAAVNIGPNPTFGEQSTKIEAHLLDFSRDVYDTRLRLEFVNKIREVKSFGSANGLRVQIGVDVERCREALNKI